MPFDAVIFDFDGVLMDTESTSLESWRREWEQHGLEIDVHTFFADHGGDVTEARYAKLAAAVGPAFDRSASHARLAAHRAQLHSELGLAPGVAEWLREAEDSLIRLAVASSSPRGWVRGLLASAGSLEAFEVLACGDEVSAPKPDPGVYLLALRRLGVPGERAVAVEDFPHGVTAAKAAGMRCIAIPNPYADPEKFGAADLVLPDASQAGLRAALRSIEPVPSEGGPPYPEQPARSVQRSTSIGRPGH
jgi:putative hydrolase of the HAD superfamily